MVRSLTRGAEEAHQTENNADFGSFLHAYYGDYESEKHNHTYYSLFELYLLQ